ncbi:MAG: hypothetical protein IJI14_09785 [Anaerolineaceae bacterium]|nr:hypothetical protein [Anaerolineaceae bacterium]
MKKLLVLFLVLMIVVSASISAMADTPIYSAYVFNDENGLPKYWLDFTGSAADNLVLHCYFVTDTWYETYYILDFVSTAQNSHQNIYRIENVYDARGTDVSNWFKTISLEIRDDSVRLFIERDPATLAGGTGSTILDGSYEMTSADAGVVYEYIEDRQLKSWLVLNEANAELHFPDGRIWYLESVGSGDYTRTVTHIGTQSGETVPFRSLTITYVQGAMLLNADGIDDFSGVFQYTPRVFLRRSQCGSEEIGRMAQLYYYRHNLFYPPAVDVKANGDGTFSVHLYEMVNNGDGTFHTATSAWYTVDASGRGSDDVTGNKIDLQM